MRGGKRQDDTWLILTPWSRRCWHGDEHTQRGVGRLTGEVSNGRTSPNPAFRNLLGGRFSEDPSGTGAAASVNRQGLRHAPPLSRRGRARFTHLSSLLAEPLREQCENTLSTKIALARPLEMTGSALRRATTERQM